ncbi:3491_t:CDS:2 [Ambispora gerdemannii]|uniref:3491_t:CDS:1 n=1 Tax=Ambispora gerdemannii TaxID=144530 RepID=A0A9N9C5D7_9GLOM|nr:3491_t:CDS:2 [Ambispora gerdemannii]
MFFSNRNTRANHLKLTPKKLAEWSKQQNADTVHGTESESSLGTLPIFFKVPESTNNEKKEEHTQASEKGKKAEIHSIQQIDTNTEVARNSSSQSLFIQENLSSRHHQQNGNVDLWQYKDKYGNDERLRDRIEEKDQQELEEMTFEGAEEGIDALELFDATLEKLYELEFENKHSLDVLENSMTNMDQEILQMRVRIADLTNDFAISPLFEEELKLLLDLSYE